MGARVPGCVLYGDHGETSHTLKRESWELAPLKSENTGSHEGPNTPWKRLPVPSRRGGRCRPPVRPRTRVSKPTGLSCFVCINWVDDGQRSSWPWQRAERRGLPLPRQKPRFSLSSLPPRTGGAAGNLGVSTAGVGLGFPLLLHSGILVMVTRAHFQVVLAYSSDGWNKNCSLFQ